MLRDPQLWMPVFTVTLPIVVTIFLATWRQNKHFDTLNKRIDDLRDGVNRRIDDVLVIVRDIQATMHDLDRRVTRLEERSSPIMRG